MMNEAIQISPNLIKGEVVKSHQELIDLANDKKSIFHDLFKVKPAAVIINMNFAIVHKMITQGKLFKTVKFIKLKEVKK